ncbi:MAG: hypothetical protein AB7T18_05755, partial [Alphaproteobacteria bacterium]
LAGSKIYSKRPPAIRLQPVRPTQSILPKCGGFCVVAELARVVNIRRSPHSAQGQKPSKKRVRGTNRPPIRGAVVALLSDAVADNNPIDAFAAWSVPPSQSPRRECTVLDIEAGAAHELARPFSGSCSAMLRGLFVRCRPTEEVWQQLTIQ